MWTYDNYDDFCVDNRRYMLDKDPWRSNNYLSSIQIYKNIEIAIQNWTARSIIAFTILPALLFLFFFNSFDHRTPICRIPILNKSNRKNRGKTRIRKLKYAQLINKWQKIFNLTETQLFSQTLLLHSSFVQLWFST